MKVPLAGLARSKLELDCRATIAAHAITAYARECAPYLCTLYAHT